MSDYQMVRVKRDWVPDWLWRLFCVGNLATFTPWREILTHEHHKTECRDQFSRVTAAELARLRAIEDAADGVLFFADTTEMSAALDVLRSAMSPVPYPGGER